MHTEKILKFIENLTKAPATNLGKYIDNENFLKDAFEEIERYISYNFSVLQRIDPVYMFFIIRNNSILMSNIPLSFDDEKTKEESLLLVRSLMESLHLHLGVIISESWMSYKQGGKDTGFPQAKEPEKLEAVTAAFSGLSRKLIIYHIKQEDGHKYLERMNFESLENYEGKLAMNIASLN